METSEIKELNEIGAKIMGWVFHDGFPPLAGIANKDGSFILKANNWNPAQNIEQAFMVVRKLLFQQPAWSFSLDMMGTSWSVVFYVSGIGYEKMGSSEAGKDQEALAIMLAIKEAFRKENP